MKREYKARGKSTKYKDMKEKYDFKFKKAAECQLNKLVEDMMEEQPGQAYSAMKKMGARPGDCENRGDFSIASHQNENLDIKESTHRILKYFSSISQKFEPLDIETSRESQNAALTTSHQLSNVSNCSFQKNWESK